MSPCKKIDDNPFTKPLILRYFPDPNGTPESDLRRILALDQDTFLLMRLGELRDAFGYCRLSGKRSLNISNTLEQNEVLTFPSRLSSQQNEMVILYRKGSAQPTEAPTFAMLRAGSSPNQYTAPTTPAEEKPISPEIFGAPTDSIRTQDTHAAPTLQSSMSQPNSEFVNPPGAGSETHGSKGLLKRIIGRLRLPVLAILFVLASSVQLYAAANDRTNPNLPLFHSSKYTWNNILRPLAGSHLCQPTDPLLPKNRQLHPINDSLSMAVGHSNPEFGRQESTAPVLEPGLETRSSRALIASQTT